MKRIGDQQETCAQYLPAAFKCGVGISVGFTCSRQCPRYLEDNRDVSKPRTHDVRKSLFQRRIGQPCFKQHQFG